jgi:hypothetical protein
MITIKSVIDLLQKDLEEYGNIEIKKLRIEYEHFDREQHARPKRTSDLNDEKREDE